MSDEPSALVSTFMALLQQAGCRAMPIQANSGNALARRDLAEIEAGVSALPGNWRIDTAERETGVVARAWLRPCGSGTVLPTYVLDRRDSFVTVRRSRSDEIGNAGSLVFGVFASVDGALDAIHNDVMTQHNG